MIGKQHIACPWTIPPCTAQQRITGGCFRHSNGLCEDTPLNKTVSVLGLHQSRSRKTQTCCTKYRQHRRRCHATAVLKKTAMFVLFKGDPNHDVGSMVVTVDSFPHSAISCDTKGRNQAKQLKLRVLIVVLSSRGPQQGMAIYYTTSASNEAHDLDHSIARNLAQVRELVTI